MASTSETGGLGGKGHVAEAPRAKEGIKRRLAYAAQIEERLILGDRPNVESEEGRTEGNRNTRVESINGVRDRLEGNRSEKKRETERKSGIGRR